MGTEDFWKKNLVSSLVWKNEKKCVVSLERSNFHIFHWVCRPFWMASLFNCAEPRRTTTPAFWVSSAASPIRKASCTWQKWNLLMVQSGRSKFLLMVFDGVFDGFLMGFDCCFIVFDGFWWPFEAKSPIRVFFFISHLAPQVLTWSDLASIGSWRRCRETSQGG